ncbi:hypothetical protein NL676_038281 [Syzygium grande]|nr:hypothetical protein NL676_038281 [Syzygium grande]
MGRGRMDSSRRKTPTFFDSAQQSAPYNIWVRIAVRFESDSKFLRGDDGGLRGISKNDRDGEPRWLVSIPPRGFSFWVGDDEDEDEDEDEDGGGLKTLAAVEEDDDIEEGREGEGGGERRKVC